MMVGIILALIGFGSLFSFISFGERHFADNYTATFHRFSIPVVLALLYWFVLSATTPYSLDSITEEKLIVETKNDVQIVTYNRWDNNNQFITKNLNTEFDKVIDEDKYDVILETYPAGWFSGIYWEGNQKLVLKEKEKE